MKGEDIHEKKGGDATPPYRPFNGARWSQRKGARFVSRAYGPLNGTNVVLKKAPSF